MTDTTIQKEEIKTLQPAAGPSVTAKEDKPIRAASDNSSAQAQKPGAKKEGPGEKGRWMYVGPTLAGIGIQNRVYTEIPDKVQELAPGMPELRYLFIPVRDYPKAGRMLRERKGYLYKAYCKVAEMQKGGAKDGR